MSYASYYLRRTHPHLRRKMPYTAHAVLHAGGSDYCLEGLRAAQQCSDQRVAARWAGNAARSLSGIARDANDGAKSQHWAKQAAGLLGLLYALRKEAAHPVAWLERGANWTWVNGSSRFSRTFSTGTRPPWARPPGNGPGDRDLT